MEHGISAVLLDFNSTLQALPGIEGDRLLQRLLSGGLRVTLVSPRENTAQELVTRTPGVDLAGAGVGLAEAARQVLQVHALPPSALALVAGVALCSRLSALSEHTGCRAFFFDPAAQQGHAGWQALPRLPDLLHRIAWSWHSTDKDCLVVGFTMKWSRERQLAARGFFPLVPRDGLVFLPLDWQQPLEVQGPFHVVLHKATDELRSLLPNQTPRFSANMDLLCTFLRAHPEVCLVDRFEDVIKVCDRIKMATLLRGIRDLEPIEGIAVRIPNQCEAQSFADPAALVDELSRHGIAAPCIVKPAVACGLPEAHQMAVVCDAAGFADLQVPLPACIQQYINHGEVVHKVYVLGDQVFVVPRASTADIAPPPTGPSPAASSTAICFHSLQPLPADLQGTNSHDSTGGVRSIHMPTIHAAVDWLNPRLGLHLYGFDVAIETTTGTHYILDVNFFPSCQEVQDAAGAFHRALKLARVRHGQQAWP
ncbi:hypothetical protein WJX72_002998 [[Myrmecia] bisecta]|uniref:Inositol-1,3,4-trisphosphate 5/6-kinase n=1 Tax=[Myrmecia] bisecta TaxID=41462 RepID=A0AAW1PSH6_9CHLO